MPETREILKKAVSKIWYAALAFFLLWLVFWDDNNVLLHIERERVISDLQDSVAYYKREIERQKIIEKDLSGDNKELELLVREQHNLKKPDEDIYIIVKE